MKMKKNNLSLLLLMASVVVIGLSSGPTLARMTEGAGTGSAADRAPIVQDNSWAGRWNSLKQTVKTKVTEWRRVAEEKWRGTPPPTAAPVPQPAPIVAVPVPPPAPTPPTPTVAAPPAAPSSGFVTQARDFLRGPTDVKTPGRKGTAASTLPLSPRGVPRLSQAKIKAERLIPRLDLGEEPRIVKRDLLLPDEKIPGARIPKVERLPSPEAVPAKEVLAWTKMRIESAKAPAILQAENFAIGRLVTSEKIDRALPEMKPEKPLAETKPVVPMTEDDLRMLLAIALNRQGGRCHAVSGLFFLAEREPRHRDEANFFLGQCAHEMGFHSEAISRLGRVVRAEDTDYGVAAVDSLVDQLPKEYEVSVGQILDRVKNQSLFSPKSLARVHYLIGVSRHAGKQYGEAIQVLNKVPTNSDVYPKARFVRALSFYSQGQSPAAINAFRELRSHLEKTKTSDRNLESLIAMNLARIHFNANQFQQAHAEFGRVHKEHPLFVEALTGLGWTQLQMGDYAGAIGNMYSLHSPYFRSVYQPESYAVRTIGYVNICQFGDAYRTLTALENQHADWLKRTDQFLKNKKLPSDYYKTVSDYIRSRKSDLEVNGLPPQVIREIARQRDFLNAQTALNSREDELLQYPFIDGIIRKDQQKVRARIEKAQARIAMLKANLKKAEVDKKLLTQVNEWQGNMRAERELVSNLNYELATLEEGRKAFAQLRIQAEKRLNKEKNEWRNVASRSLMTHLREMRTQMAQIIENNEFLRYEIFAGAGENIRYQVAGGKTEEGGRVPAEIKPTKIVNWQFDGEYWEDEIGNYRSSLRNNCPKVGSVSQPGSGQGGL